MTAERLLSARVGRIDREGVSVSNGAPRTLALAGAITGRSPPMGWRIAALVAVVSGWGFVFGVGGHTAYWMFVRGPSSGAEVWRVAAITWPMFSVLIYLFRAGPTIARLGLNSFPELNPWSWANRIIAERA